MSNFIYRYGVVQLDYPVSVNSSFLFLWPSPWPEEVAAELPDSSENAFNCIGLE